MAEEGPMQSSASVRFPGCQPVSYQFIKFWGTILYRPNSGTPGLETEEDVTSYHRSIMKHCGYDGLRVTREDVIDYLVRDHGFLVLEPIQSQVED